MNGKCPVCGAPMSANKCEYCGYQASEEVENNININNTPAANQPQINIHQHITTLPNSPKSKAVTMVLCLLLGWLGVHQFYARKYFMGILYLCTCGLFGIGIVVDFVLLLTNSFKDGNGLVIKD